MHPTSFRFTPAPLVMGILNVTPDSFSDGGHFATKEVALKHVEKLIKDGADIIDIGGESTRPGAPEVSVQEELNRVIPVLQAMREKFEIPISIDTSKFEVALEASKHNIQILNDVTGFADIRMAKLALEKNLTACVMHMQGNPRTMQENPSYPDGVVTSVQKYLKDRVRKLKELGLKKEQIWVDPGFGFGKTVDHCCDLLRHLDDFVGLGDRLLVGTSRKRFLSFAIGDMGTEIEGRDPGTITTNLWAYQQGASVFRVHDVLSMKRALKTWDAIQFGTCK